MKITNNKKMNKMTAAYLVKMGKANAEQQKLAFDYFTEQIAHSKVKASRGISKVTIRNVIIARYIELCAEAGEPISDKQACREVAEDNKSNADTVLRDFQKWKAQDDDAKQYDLQRVRDYVLNAHSRLWLSD